MMAFLGMMVQELGITFPGSINLDGSVQFSDILKDGMGFPAVANIPTFGLFQIVAFAGFAEIGAMPAAQYTGGPQNLPGGYDGSVQFSDILKDGMGFAALSNVPTFGLAQILLFGGIAETVAMPASQYTGGPQNLPGGYDGSAGTIPGGYPFTEQITDPAARTRALTCELQNGRAAMLGTFGAMCHSCVDSCDHHFFYPITHN